MREEYAIVLDFLTTGYASSFKKEPIAQALGIEHFSLLELVARPDVKILLREKVYIGQDKREKYSTSEEDLVLTRSLLLLEMN